ncbi:putative ATP12 protein [Operophtera brumata]|uniref:Putative ATP12 protein n=1 Tax=Operophtera brumata TaxID=104452 RepID=A0A0L7KVT1_OPEBR|nr:putative ATP12 protein [Operophtera brumata]
MSFLSEYKDEYWERPIRKTKIVWSEEEIEAFIKNTMKCLRGQSTYFNDFCAHLSPDEGVTEEPVEPPPAAPKLAMKDTELMKVARDLFERDLHQRTLEPLPTEIRIYGYVRPCLFRTGLSEYQQSTARVAYELIRDNRIPRYHRRNGCRPRWGLPPEGTRQPELDGI